MFGKDFFVDRYRQLGWNFSDVRLRQAIRLNHLNSKSKNVVGRLGSFGIDLEKIPFLDCGYWVRRSKVSVGATAEYLLGFYSIQEAAAQIPVNLFSSLHGELVLDACAAPGGKTVQLADLKLDKGVIVALDISRRRLSVLANHLERCFVSCVGVYNMDARRIGKMNMKFDRILLDVPCSGNFVSDMNWFNQRSMDDVQRNSLVQREILAEAVSCLNPVGEIVYSTCSLEPEEDELNIDWAVKNLGVQTVPIDCPGVDGLTEVFGNKLDPSVANCRRIWPGNTQGFFVSKLVLEERS